MREEGINFPDPTFDSEGNPEFNNLDIEDEEAFEEAFTNCEDILRRAENRGLTFQTLLQESLVSLPSGMLMLTGHQMKFNLHLKYVNQKTL